MTDPNPIDEESPSDECIAPPDHPIPADELGRYSPIRDFDSEQDIARYVEIESSGSVDHVEKLKDEYVLDENYEIWDVVTKSDRFWVLTNMTNLYSQKHFPSLDYTISFHIGLMMRLKSRNSQQFGEEATPYDEVFRRMSQTSHNIKRAVESEDFQALGMQLRECLISLINSIRPLIEIPQGINPPKSSDVMGWSDVICNAVCPSEENKSLRQYMKSSLERSWQLTSWLTHHRNSDADAASVVYRSVDNAVSNLIVLLQRKENGGAIQCPRCTSRNIRQHYDASIEPEGEYYYTCGSCGWSSYMVEGGNNSWFSGDSKAGGES